MTTTVGSGLGASFGFAAESSYGAYATPTRWIGFQSETLEWKPVRTDGKGLYAGQLTASQDQRVTTTAAVTGNVVTDFFSKGMGLLLANAMGSTATPVQQGSTAAYLQTHAWGNDAGQSLSTQIAVPDLSGNVHTKNLVGLVITDWTIDAKLDLPLAVQLTFDGKDELPADSDSATPYGPPYTSPDFQAPNPAFFWNEGSLSIGALGSEAAVEGVRAFNLTVKRPMKIDNYYLDGTGRKHAPVQNGFSSITGTIETDLLDYTDFVDFFYTDAVRSVIVTFTGGLIESAYSYQVSFAMPCVHFDTETPKVAGPEIIMPKIGFTALFDDANTPLTVAYQSTDSAL